ncbi:MAG: WbqC family protein [bacterium]
MILAAHHPCYLPPLSFFHKLHQADVLVIADDFQYITHGSINRSRIKTVRGASWLTVPVRTRGRGSQAINQVRIDEAQNWRKTHWRTLQVNYTYAAYFEQYADQMERLYHKEWHYLVDLNLAFIDFVTSVLNITTRMVRSSELNLAGTGSTKLFNMLTRLQCGTYLADMAWQGYLRPAEFEQQGFELRFFEMDEPAYHQQFSGFISGLSIIDLLFNEGADSRKALRGQAFFKTTNKRNEDSRHHPRVQ